MGSWIIRLLVVGSLMAAFFVGAAPTAVAHDPDCTAAFHFGAVKFHEGCEGHRHDGSECLASAKVMFFHQRVGCD